MRQRCFVIVDQRDNSITFSSRLFRLIRKIYKDKLPKVFVFYIPEYKKYAFTINPDFEQPTQLADIQYNSRHKCIGFESLNPTVAKILYDYGLPNTDRPCKLTVRLRMKPEYCYFTIERPPHNQQL